MRARRYQVVAVATTAAGLLLFGALVYETGPAEIVRNVRDCGVVFVYLLLLSGARHALRTLAWQLSIAPEHRVVSFVDLFNIRLAAEAVTDLTFAGPVLGESAKALAISQRIPATNTLSSIVIENLCYSLSVVLFIMSGVVAFVLGVALPHRTQWAVLLVGVGLLLPVVALQVAINQRVLVVTGLLDRLARRGIRVAALDRRREKIRQFEDEVVRFYTERKALFLTVLLVEMATSLTGVAEAVLILGVTAGRTSLYAGYIVESVNRLVNAVFPFLPLRVGVDEGGAALVLGALGYTAAVGVSLAVIRKIRSIFWIALGLLCMVRYAVGVPTGRPKEDTDSESRRGNETADRQRG